MVAKGKKYKSRWIFISWPEKKTCFS